MRHSVALAALGALLCASSSWGEAPTCLATAEEAAQAFVRQSINDPGASPGLLTLRSLATYRARLEQLLDDRYSPDSGPLRARLLGTDISPAQLRAMSHTELVGMFQAAGASRRQAVGLGDVQVTGKSTRPYLGDEVTVSYRLTIGSAETHQERTFSVSSEQGCWKLDVPVEAWVRLDQLAKILKESRTEPQFKVRGMPRASVRVAAASASPFTGSAEHRQRDTSHAAAWVANSPLLTERDLVGVSASWDCDAGRGPEDAAIRLHFSERGTAALAKWSKDNLGTMLAVVIDGEVRTFARVSGVLGSKLSVCLPRMTLDDAESLARRLAGMKQ
jgi:hypothetical protein